MGTREQILKAVRSSKREFVQLPEIPNFAEDPKDLSEKFGSALKRLAGDLVPCASPGHAGAIHSSCEARYLTISGCIWSSAGKHPKSCRVFSSMANVSRPPSPRVLARMKARSASVSV